MKITVTQTEMNIAYDFGIRARVKCKDRTASPFPVHTPQRRAWYHGYDKAHSALSSVVTKLLDVTVQYPMEQRTYEAR